MRLKKDIEFFSQYFKNRQSFTSNDVYDFFSKNQEDIKRATVNWRIYELVQQGLLQRIGRGVYTLGKEKCFTPVLYKKQINVAALLKKQFPLISFCCWHTSILKEFFQHIVMHDFLLVEVEREVKDAVFHFIKESNKNTFNEPLREFMENYVLISQDAVIVKNLISEAPLQNVNSTPVPTLEKILVDLYADSGIFYFLQGKEILTIFENALGKYTVNIDRMMRYAARRNKNEELQKIVAQISGK